MFNKTQVYEIIENTLQENSQALTLSETDKYKTYTTYKQLMYEKVNVNKTIEEQEDLITAIIIGRNTFNDKGEVETWNRIFTEHSDLKHLSYYDNFLREGEADKIITALKKHGLSTEVLRGVKANQEVTTTIDGATVHQEVEEDDEGYKYVSYFSIEYNGNIIYEYDSENIIPEARTDEQMDYKLEELSDYSNEFSDSQNTRIRRTTKTNVGKSISDYYVTKSGNVAERRMGYYVDANGKRKFGFIGGGLV